MGPGVLVLPRLAVASSPRRRPLALSARRVEPCLSHVVAPDPGEGLTGTGVGIGLALEFDQKGSRSPLPLARFSALFILKAKVPPDAPPLPDRTGETGEGCRPAAAAASPAATPAERSCAACRSELPPGRELERGPACQVLGPSVGEAARSGHGMEFCVL